MLEELSYQLDRLDFWWYQYSHAHWLNSYFYHYPITSGIIIGFIAGFYIEEIVWYFERKYLMRKTRKHMRRKK